MIGEELEKVKGQREKGTLKTKHKKLKFSGKPKSYTNGALTPLIITRHVAMMHVAPPLRIKYGMLPQQPCLGRKPFIFRWSSWCATTTTEPGGQLMGLTKFLFTNDLIKYIRPPWHNTNEDRQVINERIQYCRQLQNSCRTVGSSSKPTFMNPDALQKEH